MVAVQIGPQKDTRYIIGDFWDIVERLKQHGAWFRFRARRWRWSESLAVLEETMQPYEVAEVTFSQANLLQLAYDQAHIKPTQEWLKINHRLAKLSVEWWEAVRFRRKNDPKSKKLYETYKERVNLALESLDIVATELSRDQIVALQQSRRAVEMYQERLLKWIGEQAKLRRHEELLRRFEKEMGVERGNLAQTENAARQALYEELAGLEWTSREISELKAVAKLLLKNKAS